jgi:threonine dehydrogenase-like Zn-dependent dehydrogenase
VPMDAAFMKEVALRPSLGYCSHHGRRRDFVEAADLLAARPELTSTLITHRFPIEDAVEAFRLAQDKSKGACSASWLSPSPNRATAGAAEVWH